MKSYKFNLFIYIPALVESSSYSTSILNSVRKWINCILFLISGFTIFGQVPLHVPSNGLVGYWPIFGDANDYSGNEFHARVNGATLTEDRFGESFQAYQLDGIDDYLIFNNYSALQPDSSFTISAWIYIDSLCDNNAKVISFENDIPPNYSTYQLIIGDKNEDSLGRFSLGVRTLKELQPPSNGEYHRTAFKGSDIISEWQHVVASWDGKVMTCYQNGIMVNETLISGSLFYDSGRLNIGLGRVGSLAPGREIFYKGMIDEIAFWDRALTSNEVRKLYNGPPCITRLSVTDTLFIEVGLTSLDPVTFKNVFKVYPNPANDYLIVDIEDYEYLLGYKIRITNGSGVIIKEFVINDETLEISIDDWGGIGLYFLELLSENDNLIDVKKIILQ